jgi:CHASE3 domain sensor protein
MSDLWRSILTFIAIVLILFTLGFLFFASH